MKKIIYKKLLCYLFFIFILLIFTLIYSLLLYNNILKPNEDNIRVITYIGGIIIFLLLGLVKGLLIKKNGMLEGLLSGLFIMFLFLLINFIIKKNFSTLNIIKIIVFVISSTIGGIIGVNLSKK